MVSRIPEQDPELAHAVAPELRHIETAYCSGGRYPRGYPFRRGLRENPEWTPEPVIGNVPRFAPKMRSKMSTFLGTVTLRARCYHQHMQTFVFHPARIGRRYAQRLERCRSS